MGIYSPSCAPLCTDSSAPWKAIMLAADSHDSPGDGPAPAPGEGWSEVDLEQAYQRALEESSEAPWPLSPVTTEPGLAVAEERDSSITAEFTAGEGTVPAENPLTVTTASLFLEEETAELSLLPPETPGEGPEIFSLAANPSPKKTSAPQNEETRVSPAHVLEAALFVGGPPYSAKKLSGLLRGSFDIAAIERTIDELNQEYAAQQRPYEIRLGDGGYRLDLRPEYEKIRLRVHGGGPREVRLSQDLLEILAVVAYRQPISAEEFQALGRKNAGPLLRQLLRRELIALRRNEQNPKEVYYHTTSRFLSLFGLGSLEELPQPEDVDLK